MRYGSPGETPASAAPAPSSEHAGGLVGPSASLPARKADMGAASFPIGADMFGEQLEHTAGPAQPKSASAVAEPGVSGPGQSLPHRAEMERSFGVDLGDVRAHADDSSRNANVQLQSTAFTLNNHIGFRDANPDKVTVAHEVTHVLQQTRSSSYHGKNEGGIDTGGESEANAVETAVRSNSPASRELTSTTQSERTNGAARLVSRKPALFRAKDFGLTVLDFGDRGAKALEGSYNLVPNAAQFYFALLPFSMVPLPAKPIVPGLYGRLAPELKLKLAPIATDYKHEISSVALAGALGFGVLGGQPSVAEVFATAKPTLAGGGKVERKPKDGGTWWKLSLSFSLSGSLAVGLKVGPLTIQYTKGPYSLFKYDALSYGTDGFKAGTAGLGQDLKNFINWLWGKVQAVGRFISKYGEKAIKFLEKYGEKALSHITDAGELIGEGVTLFAQVSEAVGNVLNQAGKAIAKSLITQAYINKYTLDPDNWEADWVVRGCGQKIYKKINPDSADSLTTDPYEALDVLGVDKVTIKALAIEIVGSKASPEDVEDMWSLTPLKVVDRLKSKGKLSFRKAPEVLAARELGV